jgi:hypothetical protein
VKLQWLKVREETFRETNLKLKKQEVDAEKVTMTLVQMS